MNSPADLHAWVDESMHNATPTMPEGIYILAATIADPATCDPIRDELRKLRPRGAAKLHWYDLAPRDRRVAAKTLAIAGASHTVVTGAPLDARKQERARRLCMVRLLHELDTLGVSTVRVEARTASLDRRDVQLINALRSQRAIPRSLTVEFVRAENDPMLWFPDTVAGAVGARIRGEDPTPYDSLRTRLVEHTIRMN
ncbi:MAG: hypothetical protein ACTH31_14060 [Pseudoclavibacter sp.]